MAERIYLITRDCVYLFMKTFVYGGKTNGKLWNSCWQRSIIKSMNEISVNFKFYDNYVQLLNSKKRNKNRKLDWKKYSVCLYERSCGERFRDSIVVFVGGSFITILYQVWKVTKCGISNDFEISRKATDF